MDPESSALPLPPLLTACPSVPMKDMANVQMATTDKFRAAIVDRSKEIVTRPKAAILDRSTEIVVGPKQAPDAVWAQSSFPIRNQPDQMSPLCQSPSPASAPAITPAVADTVNTFWLKIIADEFHRHGTVDADQLLPECSIYVVPPDISQFDSEAYKPAVVSIGPYHYKNQTFFSDAVSHPYRDMHLFKWRCVRSFMLRWSQYHPDDQTDEVDLLSRCILKMKSHDARIRRCYSKDTIRVTSDEELAAIMMLDGCFILYLLLDRDHRLMANNQVAGRVWIWTRVRYDLLLLENQIPFFILYELLDFWGIGKHVDVDLVESALNLFEDCYPRRTEGFPAPKKDRIHHLLHLFYMSRLPIHPLNVATAATQIWIPRATELTDFGVRFHRNDNANSFLDVSFTKKGVMKIPPLLIDDYSKNLFRNLIAFEQCYPFTGCHISVYTWFMDCIIDSEQDARLLHLNGILVNMSSADQDIARFFSNLSRGVHFERDRFYLANLFTNVTEYKDNKFNKCLGDFKRTYCTNTWAVFAAAVSIVFFILTTVQTFFTVFPYYNPRD